MRSALKARLNPRQTGITLLETLVALALGLAIMSAAFNLYTSNRAAFKQINGVTRLQESARVAATLLSTDIRQAGGALCRNGVPTTNVVNSTDWWAQPDNGIEGFEETAADNRASQTSYGRQAGDSLTIWSSNAGVATVVAAASTRTRQNGGGNGAPTGDYSFNVNDASGFKRGDLIVICDPNLALLAQAALPQNGNPSGAVGTLRVLFNSAQSPSPGNCGAAFKASYPQITALPSCALSPAAYTASSPLTVANDYTWDTGSMVGTLTAHHWYIGRKTTASPDSLNNLALRRLTINYDRSSNGAISATPVSDEMVENVSDMQITYLVGTPSGYPATTAYVNANDPSLVDWTRVIAVKVVLTLTGTEADAVDTSGAATASTYTTVPITVAIRSRLPGRVVASP